MSYPLNMAGRRKLEDLLAAGATALECQASLEIALGTVYRWCAEIGVLPRAEIKSLTATVIQLATEGYTAREICALTGLAKSRVYQAAKTHRVRLANRRTAHLRKVKRLVRAGELSASQIAHRTGLTVGGVLHHAARLGVTLPDGRARSDRIVADLAAGAGVKATARRHRVAPNHVRRARNVRDRKEAVA